MVSNEVYVAIVEAKEQVSELFEIHGDLMSSVEDVYTLVYRLLIDREMKIAKRLAVLTVLSTGSINGPFSGQFMMPSTAACCEEFRRIKAEFRKGFASVVVYDSNNNNVTAIARVSKQGRVTLEVYPVFCKGHTKHQKAYLHKQEFGWLTPSMRLI